MMSTYMLAALKALDALPPEKVKTIAVQFATQGANGYSVDSGVKYSIPALPDKRMSGYETLAWYYVSMAKAFPQLLPQLKLPYDKSYEIARQMFGAKR